MKSSCGATMKGVERPHLNKKINETPPTSVSSLSEEKGFEAS
jgi:hypothetical protein